MLEGSRLQWIFAWESLPSLQAMLNAYSAHCCVGLQVYAAS